ncbi:MAG: ribonuclease HII [Burkholderiales bacterium]
MARPLVCGVDEAGRGPLAGPVYAACVILGGKRVRGLADSKTLSEERREELALVIKEKAMAWSIAFASVTEIERINILQASLLAMKRAVETLSLAPEEVLVDGLHCPQIIFPSRALVHGDALRAEISAASILAKTARDAEMREWHEQFPNYGFRWNKGYATEEHLLALDRYGMSAIHRKTFAPVKALINFDFKF